MELAGIPDRIAARIVYHEDSGCLEWTGYRDSAGYGQVSVDGRVVLFHRYMYRQLTGKEIPPKHVLDHMLRDRTIEPGPCKIGPSCGCPDHLDPVPVAVNSKRVRPWNSRKTVCTNGHEYAVHGIKRTCGDGRVRRFCSLCEGGKGNRYTTDA